MSTPAADPELLAAACRFAAEAGALTLEWFRSNELDLEHKGAGTPRDIEAWKQVVQNVKDAIATATASSTRSTAPKPSPAACRCIRRWWRLRTNTARRSASSSYPHWDNGCSLDVVWAAPSSTSTESVPLG